MANEEPMLTTHGQHGQTRQIRIGRGATVMGTDGPIGAVHQIIMDQHTGELQALVIATGDVRQLELPASHIVRSDGSTVYLDISRADLRLHPDLAKVYNPNQYVPVRENPILPPSEAGDEARFTERPVVTNIERDAVGVVVPQPSTHKEDMTASVTTPEPERYIPETPPPSVKAPLPAQPNSEPTVVDTHVIESESQTGQPAIEMDPAPHGAVNPRTGSIAGSIAAEGAPTAAAPAPLIPANEPVYEPEEEAPEPVAEPVYEPLDEQADDPANAAVPPVAEDNADNADDVTIPDELAVTAEALPLVTSFVESDEVIAPETDMTAANAPDVQVEDTADTGAGDMDVTDSAIGLKNATRDAGTETDVPAEEEEEAEVVEGSLPPVNPVNPGATSDTIHSDQNRVNRVLDESQQARTGSTMNRRGWGRQGLTSSSSEMYGSRMTWIPAVALGALIVGVATWSTLRAIRRGRRKAVKAARNARMNVRESVMGAGRSAADMAQTMRANAQQMVASPQLMATDALSNFADIPARYRWFRRGMRVGSRVERLRGKMS